MFGKVTNAARGVLGKSKNGPDVGGGVERLRTIIDALPDLAWAQTAEGRVEYANARFAGFASVPQTGAAMHEVWPRIVSPAEITALTLAINACLRSGRVYEGVHKLRPAAGGESRMHLVRAVPFEGGAEPNALVTAADVHDDVEHERLVEMLPRAPEPPPPAALVGSGSIFAYEEEPDDEPAATEPAVPQAPSPVRAAAFAAELQRVELPRIVLSGDGLLLSMNRLACDGLEIDDLDGFIGGIWIDAWTGADRDAASRALASARDGSPASFVGFLPTLTGRPKWWDVRVSLATGQNDRLDVTLREVEEPERPTPPVEEPVVPEGFGDWKQPEPPPASAASAKAMLDDPIVRRALATAALADAVPAMLWASRPDGTFDFVNARLTAFTGMTAEELDGASWDAIVHPEDATALLAAWHEAIAERGQIEHEVRMRRGEDGSFRWHALHAVPSLDESGTLLGWYGTATDVDDRRRAAESLAFLATANDTVSLTLDLDATLRAMADAAVPALADGCVIFLYDGRDRANAATVAHTDVRIAQALVATFARFPALNGEAIVDVIESGTARLDAAISGPHLATIARSAEHYKMLRDLGTRSQMILPLVGRDRAFGAMLVISTTPRKHFSEADLAIAKLFAKRAAVSIENVRLYERDRRAADALRATYRPRPVPRFNGAAFDGAQRAGDERALPTTWYDVFRLPDGKIGISLGDVAEASVAGAVAAMNVRLALRTAALVDARPGEMLAAAGTLLALDEQTAATAPRAFAAVYDPSIRRLRYALAGIAEPLLRRSDGRVAELGGLRLAADEYGTGDPREVLLDEGATIAVATPGLLAGEADRVKAGRRVRRAFEDLAETERGVSAAELLDSVVAPGDAVDVAVLTMYVRPRARAAPAPSARRELGA